jgi:hypothetical protein
VFLNLLCQPWPLTYIFLSRAEESDIQSRELGVLFQNLRVVGLGAAANYQETFGSMFNPRGIAENIRAARHPATRDILSGFNGVVRPGEMIRELRSMLFLGAPLNYLISRSRTSWLRLHYLAQNARQPARRVLCC